MLKTPVDLERYRVIISGIHEPCGLPHAFGEGCFDEWYDARCRLAAAPADAAERRYRFTDEQTKEPGPVGAAAVHERLDRQSCFVRDCKVPWHAAPADAAEPVMMAQRVDEYNLHDLTARVAFADGYRAALTDMQAGRRVK